MYKNSYLQGHKLAYRFSAMTTLASRLKQARKEAGLTQRELAESAGVKQPVISQIERGENLKSAYAAALARACGVEAAWLADGIEPMRSTYRGSAGNSPIESNAVLLGPMSPWDSDTELDDDEVEVPLYKEVELAAGGGATQVIEVPGRKLRFARSTLREAGVLPQNAACATANGRSMERLIMDGATIGIDLGTTNIIDGEIYAFDHDGMLRVKYLYRLPGGGVRVRSENEEEYPDENLTAEEAKHMRILGWVFWWSTVRRRRGLSIAK